MTMRKDSLWEREACSKEEHRIVDAVELGDVLPYHVCGVPNVMTECAIISVRIAKNCEIVSKSIQPHIYRLTGISGHFYTPLQSTLRPTH